MSSAPLFQGGTQVRYEVVALGQANIGTSAAGLPNLPPNWKDRVSRVVLRSIGQPINIDPLGSPTSTTGWPLLKDEIIVFDGADLETFKMIRASTASGDADVRIMYMGT